MPKEFVFSEESGGVSAKRIRVGVGDEEDSEPTSDFYDPEAAA